MNRRYSFCASHRLHSPTLSPQVNQEVFGKCNNPYGHGHDYVLDVSVSGELDAATGLIVKLKDLDNLVNAEILGNMAHRNLNIDVSEFSSLIPTTENLALVIGARLGAKWNTYFPQSSAWLSGISVRETDRNSVAIVIGKPVSKIRLGEPTGWGGEANDWDRRLVPAAGAFE